MASHGQPSRKQPSGPLLRHFLQPMQRMGSIAIRPNGVLSSSGTQNMQSSTGQYSTHAGEPAQHSVITASSFGFFLRGVVKPLDFGSHFISSGTIPTALGAPGAAGMASIITRIRRLSRYFSCQSCNILGWRFDEIRSLPSGTKPTNGNSHLYSYLAVFLVWLKRRLLSMVRPHVVAAHICRGRVHRDGLLPASFPPTATSVSAAGNVHSSVRNLRPQVRSNQKHTAP